MVKLVVRRRGYPKPLTAAQGADREPRSSLAPPAIPPIGLALKLGSAAVAPISTHACPAFPLRALALVGYYKPLSELRFHRLPLRLERLALKLVSRAQQTTVSVARIKTNFVSKGEGQIPKAAVADAKCHVLEVCGRFHGRYPPNYNEGTHLISGKGPTRFQVVPI